MYKILKENRQEELRLKIGETCFSLQIRDPFIRRRVSLHYENYISDNDPNIYVEVEYRDFLEQPLCKSVFFQTPSWKLCRDEKGYFIYFPISRGFCLARFDSDFNRIRFYTQDPTGQLLLYLFYVVICGLILPRNNTLMLHASGVINSERAYLFVAPSGGGKSTIANLAIRKGFAVLNDDKIIIHCQEALSRIYGNPWHGDVREVSSCSSVINEVFFIKVSDFNQIKRISKTEAIVEFIKNSFCLPLDGKMVKDRLDICYRLANNLCCYSLNFRPDMSIWSYLDEFFK
jgi:hypothetical protein